MNVRHVVVMNERALHLFTAQLLRLFAKPNVLWFHPPQEGLRSPRTGAFLKRMGTLGGVSDLILCLPPTGRMACLELKSAKGRLAESQRAFREAAFNAGAAYAVAEAFGWEEGLERHWREAKKFYAIIGIATLAGTALDFTPVDPMKALYWSAVINGVVAVPIMAAMMLLVAREKVMGAFVASRRTRWLGWAGTALMGFAVVSVLHDLVAESQRRSQVDCRVCINPVGGPSIAVQPPSTESELPVR